MQTGRQAGWQRCPILATACQEHVASRHLGQGAAEGNHEAAAAAPARPQGILEPDTPPGVHPCWYRDHLSHPRVHCAGCPGRNVYLQVEPQGPACLSGNGSQVGSRDVLGRISTDACKDG